VAWVCVRRHSRELTGWIPGHLGDLPVHAPPWTVANTTNPHRRSQVTSPRCFKCAAFQDTTDRQTRRSRVLSHKIMTVRLTNTNSTLYGARRLINRRCHISALRSLSWARYIQSKVPPSKIYAPL